MTRLKKVPRFRYHQSLQPNVLNDTRQYLIIFKERRGIGKYFKTNFGMVLFNMNFFKCIGIYMGTL
jgi:hypothetical protein